MQRDHPPHLWTPVATAAPANPDRRVVTVWSELASPVAALALHTLRRCAQERRVDLLIDHRAYPHELLTQAPTPKDVLDAEIALISARNPELGWRTWQAPDASYPVTTMLAMEAVQIAKRAEAGGLRAGDQLDAALRRAMFVDSRCISLYPVVVDVARRCPLVDRVVLLEALAVGVGRTHVISQWATAAGDRVQGSPHLFTQGGFAEFSPGVQVVWPDGTGVGSPRLDDDGDGWAHRLLDTL